MPGVLLDDMAFSLDSVSAASSSLFDSPSSSYNHLSHYLLNSSSPSDTKCFHYEEQALLESIMASVSTSDSPRGTSDSPRVIPCSMLDTRLSPPGGADNILDSPRSGSDSPRSLPCGSFDSALHRFLPSNNTDEATWSAEDVYSCDEFRMFEFKVRRCMRGRSHDWTECPFAHPGEKARRRDPRRFHYSGTACPDFRKGSCKNGDSCELAHGVFECWLHPARYRTQPCKDGRSCKRRVCFFAHTPDQLRLLPSAGDSPVRSTPASSPRKPKLPVTEAEMKLTTSCLNCNSQKVCCGKSRMMQSPTSILSDLSHSSSSPPPLSPPLSPSPSPPLSPSQTRRRSCGFVSAPTSPSVTRGGSICELANALQQLEVQKPTGGMWLYSTGPSPLRHGTTGSSSVSQCMSLPCTPTNKSKWDTMWEMDLDEEANEETMTTVPRVESGRDLRAKIYGRLAGRAEAAAARLAQGSMSAYGSDIAVNDPCPDINWVNDLVTE